MSRDARISKSLSEIKKIIDAGGIIPVVYRYNRDSSYACVIAEQCFITDYTNCATYPLTVTFPNGLVITFTADGYRYSTYDNLYITLESEPTPSTHNKTFERFMKIAATEGVSAEVAMNMYSSFKQ